MLLNNVKQNQNPESVVREIQRVAIASNPCIAGAGDLLRRASRTSKVTVGPPGNLPAGDTERTFKALLEWVRRCA